MSKENVTYLENPDDFSLSRYRGVRLLLNDSNIPIQESWFIKAIEERSDDYFYQIPPECDHRPDLIAEKVYGTPWLYWIVGFANDMTDSIAESYKGRKLKLPSVDHVYEILRKL